MKRFTVLILAVALAVLTVAFFEPGDMLRGWLAGFVWAVMVPLGSLTLVLAHRITGGEWGEALAPVLLPAAKAILPAALLSIPILLFSQTLYGWPSAEIPAAVAAFYMNATFFACRSILALAILSALTWIGRARGEVLSAALGLVAIAIASNVVPADWILAVQPGFYSSAFGFGFLIEAVLVALSLCAVFGPQGEDRRECRDLAGLLIAALLGTMYFVYMQFVVIWYGNLPDSAAWYIVRSEAPWPAIGAIALALGAVLPFLALLNKELRESETALRAIGVSVLLGVAIHVVWLIVPSFGLLVLGPAILSITLTSLMLAAWLHRAGLRWTHPAEIRTADAHHG